MLVGIVMKNNRLFIFLKTQLKRASSTGYLFSASLPQLWSPTSKPTFAMAEIFAIILVVVFVLLFIISRIRKNAPNELMMELDDAEFINSILLRVAETQTRLDIICTRQGLEHRHLQGYCRISDNHFNQNSPSYDPDQTSNIIMDIHAGGIVTGWDDAPVDIYFQLSQNDQCTLYHFASFVSKIRKKGPRTILEIIRPSILSDSKAKETVQIEPPHDMIALASAWFYNTSTPVLPRSISKLGKSHAMFRPTGNSDFRVISISASGIRLRFLRDVLEDLEKPLKKGHQICLLLAINTGDEKDERMLLWVKGSCAGFAPCLDNDCLDAIFSFTHWQQIRAKSDEIKWYPATDTDRVPPLMHWIMHAEKHQDTTCNKID